MLLCMDWRYVKFDWNRARAFLVTAEEGSLSAAARALNMAQPTLGRQVDALEKELNVVLFQRVGRGLSLTPSGLELLTHVKQMGNAASTFSIAAHGQSQSIEGNISIAASETYAANLLPPIIAKLHMLEPKIKIELVVSSDVSDLRRREADIAIRHFRPTEPDLIAKKIGDAHAKLYASDAYVNKIGNPKQINDLNDAEFVNIDHQNSVMHGLNSVGFNLTKANFPIETNNYLVMWELVKQGIAIGVLDSRIGDKEKSVKQVLPDMPPLTFPIWLVAHRELSNSRRIRMVYDLLASELLLDT